MQQPVESLMKTTMENIKNMIDVNTVVGDAVETKDGTVIVPVSRVSFAFVAGGGEYPAGQDNQGNTQDGDGQGAKMPFAGGSGAGVTVQPIGFLATTNGQLKVLPVNYNNSMERLIDMVPTFISNLEDVMTKRAEKREDAQNEGE